MIPLRYNSSVNDAYEKHIEGFKKRLNGWISKGYVGERKDTGKAEEWKRFRASRTSATQRCFNSLFPNLDATCDNDSFSASKYIIDDGAKNALLHFRDMITIDVLINKNTAEMLKLIEDVERDYPDVKNHLTQTYKVLRHAFVDLGYEKLDKGKFLEATEIGVCPYCNRTFIQNVDITKTNMNGEIYKAEIKGELDHFLNKEKYPYLALCRYNLVPSCPFCNHTKSNADNPNIISPYDLTDHNGIRFRMEITGSHFTDMKECANAITIKVDDNTNGIKPSMEDNIKGFHLRELYSTHTDYAAEIYYKGKLRWNPAYRYWLRKVVAPLNGCSMTNEEIERYILGNYTQPEKFNKRPLSKFQHDLAVDAKIIKK